MNLQWLGHNCWLLDTGEHKLLIDPFLDDSPTAPIKAADVDPDFILVSHGHFDHVSDVVSIAERTNARIMCGYEVGGWFAKKGIPEENIVQLNPGGGATESFGRLEMTVAHHSSSMPDGSYGGVACGMIVSAGGKKIYFACDTALFSDMRMIGEAGLDLAVLPIGDRFTMGPEDAVRAAGLLHAARVAPCHYNTWPPIEQDAHAWAKDVRAQTSSEPVVLEPGASIEV